MVIFTDGWDYYDNQDLKWNAGSAQATINLTGTKSRTGAGCLIINSGFQGPLLNLPSLSRFIYGDAVYANILGGDILTCGQTVPPPNFYFANCRITINSDGSVSANGPLGTLGTSAAGLWTANTYHYIECDITISTTAGAVAIWVDDVLVLNLTGVNTQDHNISANCNALRILGLGGSGEYRHDDFYVIDPASSPNTSRLGPIQIMAGLPVSDSTPLQWTPSTGVTHFNLVNAVPQNNGTTYVQTANAGDTDQYLYDFSGVPTDATILSVFHTLDSALDSAGGGSVGSSVNGTVTGSTALSTSYVMAKQMYNTNPGTGIAWTVADIVAAKIGPNRTV